MLVNFLFLINLWYTSDMTRIGFMSDLHLDSNQFGEAERMQLLQVLQEEQIDHLHLAGDISNDFKQMSLPFIQDLQTQLPVSFNLGNHDMLYLSEEEIHQYDFQVQTMIKFKGRPTFTKSVNL